MHGLHGRQPPPDDRLLPAPAGRIVVSVPDRQPRGLPLAAETAGITSIKSPAARMERREACGSIVPESPLYLKSTYLPIHHMLFELYQIENAA